MFCPCVAMKTHELPRFTMYTMYTQVLPGIRLYCYVYRYIAICTRAYSCTVMYTHVLLSTTVETQVLPFIAIPFHCWVVGTSICLHISTVGTKGTWNNDHDKPEVIFTQRVHHSSPTGCPLRKNFCFAFSSLDHRFPVKKPNRIRNLVINFWYDNYLLN